MAKPLNVLVPEASIADCDLPVLGVVRCLVATWRCQPSWRRSWQGPCRFPFVSTESVCLTACQCQTLEPRSIPIDCGPLPGQEVFAADGHEIMQIMVRYIQAGFDADDQTREYVHEASEVASVLFWLKPFTSLLKNAPMC